MKSIKVLHTLFFVLPATLAMAGCTAAPATALDSEGTVQPQGGEVKVYWTASQGGRVVINETSVTQAEMKAVLAARASGTKVAPAGSPAAGSSERVGTSQQAITTGSQDWANVCSNFDSFLVTSGSNGSGDSFFCATYADPFSTTGIPIPFVPQWFDPSDANMFSLCTSQFDCFAGDGACSFTTNWLTVPAGFDNNVGTNINPPPSVLFLNGQSAPLVC